MKRTHQFHSIPIKINNNFQVEVIDETDEIQGGSRFLLRMNQFRSGIGPEQKIKQQHLVFCLCSFPVTQTTRISHALKKTTKNLQKYWQKKDGAVVLLFWTDFSLF